MKIRTQLIISTAFFTLALLVILASVIVTNQRVDQLSTQAMLAKNVELEANDLSYVTNDYLLYHGSVQLDRWNEKFDSLSADMANLSVDSADQQTLLNSISDSQRRLKAVFDDIVTGAGSTQSSQSTVDPAFLQVSWSRVGVLTQGMVFDASRLNQKLQAEQDQMKMLNYVLIIVLLGLFGAFMLTSYFLIYRRTLKSIADLQAEAKVIGSGNFNHIIERKGNDEFAELTGSFNQMTMQLKTVTASKVDLEREVTDRKRAEEALRESEERFRALNETSPVGVGVSLEGVLVYTNPAYERILGYEHGELLGVKASDLYLDPAERSRWLEVMKEKGVVQDFEIRLKRKDGTPVWVLINTSPIIYGHKQSVIGTIQDITERKRAEAKILQLNQDLNRRVAELQTLFDLVPISVSIALDKECSQISANKAFMDLVGMKPGSNISQNAPQDEKPSFRAFLHGKELPLEELPMQKAAWTGKPVRGAEFDAVFADGHVINFYGHATPLFDEQGKVRGAIGAFDDMTERKRAEEALNVSNRKINEILASIRDDFYVLDRNWKFIYANRQFTSKVGKEPEDFIGNSIWEMFPNHLGTVLEENYRAAMEKREIRRFTLHGKYTDAWYEMSVYPSAEGISLLGTDITGRKRAEEERERLLADLKAKTTELELANEELEVKTEEMAAQAEELECANEELRTNNEELQRVTQSLHETQDYLENLINYANAPIIVWDPKFTITRFNHAFERLSGYYASEVIGKDLSALFPSESREESLDKIKKTLEGEQWESVEIPIQHKHGNVRIALWNSANIYGNDNVLLATIAQGQDITTRKEAERALEEAKSQAELYLDLMGHDISNMHQIMMMQLEIAREIMDRERKLEADDRDIIEITFRTLERAARLIDNVRKLQKMRTGEYRSETIDVSKVLEEVLDTYSDIPGRSVTINYVPDGRRPVLANPLLKDVFNNLVDNAVKHSGDPLEISVDIHKVGQNGNSYYRIALEDNGNGIPDGKKEEVFHRFKRGQTKARGTGLGLYLVKSLVEGFGGHVEVENRVLGDYTKGTRFLVYLPVAREGDDAG